MVAMPVRSSRTETRVATLEAAADHRRCDQRDGGRRNRLAFPIGRPERVADRFGSGLWRPAEARREHPPGERPRRAIARWPATSERATADWNRIQAAHLAAVTCGLSRPNRPPRRSAPARFSPAAIARTGEPARFRRPRRVGRFHPADLSPRAVRPGGRRRPDYFIWGLGPASPILFILALSLIAGWLVF